MGSIHGKNWRSKISYYCPFKGTVTRVFGFPNRPHIDQVDLPYFFRILFEIRRDIREKNTYTSGIQNSTETDTALSDAVGFPTIFILYSP